MNKFLVLVVVVVAIWVIVSSFGSAKPTDMTNDMAADKSAVRVGFIGPLSGDAASIGEPIMNAVKIAVEEVNTAGGINGAQLEVIYEDGKCTGPGALSAAQKLINVDNVKVIIGGLCSGETLGAAPIAESSKVVLFSPGSGSPDITKAGDYIFRNFPSDASSGKKLAEVAVGKNQKKIAIVSESSEYAQAVKGVFVTRLKELGGTVVTDERFVSTAKDIRSQVTKAIASKPDAIYFVPQTPSNAILGMTQIRQLGFKGQILSNEFLNAEEVVNAAKTAVEGAIYAEPLFDENRKESKMVLDKYKAKYGEKLPGGVPPVYLATAYDSVYVLADQIKKNGLDVDKIKAGLYSIKDWVGSAGVLIIDSNGDPVFEYVTKQIKDGKGIEVK